MTWQAGCWVVVSEREREGGGVGVLTGPGDVASERERGGDDGEDGGGGGGGEESSDVSRMDAFPDLGEAGLRGRRGGI